MYKVQGVSLLQLSILFLGVTSDNVNVQGVNVSEANHRAILMAKLMYCFKNYLY